MPIKASVKLSFDEITKSVKGFVENELFPLENNVNFREFHLLEEILQEKREKVKRLDLWLPHISKEYGGLGLSYSQFGEISSMLGQSPYGHYVFNCQAPDVGNMEILIEYGTDYQKKTFLEPLLKGEIRSCFAMTEPDTAGSNPLLLSSFAEQKNDAFVLNGRKWFTTGAEGSAFTIAMLNTSNADEQPYEKASLFIVPAGTKGYNHLRKISVMGDVGGGWGSHSEIEFDNCKVHDSLLLGKVGQGFEIAQSRLNAGRIHHCMRWVGICERVLDMICKRSVIRHVEKDKSLATKQHIQFMIAENYANIKAARLMILDVAKKMESSHLHDLKADISTIKFFTANILKRVLDDAVQTYGAAGLSDDTLLAFWFRHERAASIYDGPNEVHKQVCAKNILKKYFVKGNMNKYSNGQHK